MKLRAIRNGRESGDRLGTAAALRHLVDAAEEPPSYWRAQGIDPPLRSDVVLAARDDLLAIAAALEARSDLPPAVLATAEWLAWSTASPVCAEPEDDADLPDVAARLAVIVDRREAGRQRRRLRP